MDTTIRIPSAELTGTRAQKVMQLDAILSRLYVIRRELSPAPNIEPLRRGSGDSPADRWWLAGLSCVAALGAFTAWCWATGITPALDAAASVARLAF